MKVERKEIDFSRGKRGAVIPSHGKTAISIRIDDDVLDWFRDQATAAGGGSYQTMINDALRGHIDRSTGDSAEAKLEAIRNFIDTPIKTRLSRGKTIVTTRPGGRSVVRHTATRETTAASKNLKRK